MYQSLRAMISKRPWLLVVFFLAGMVALSVALALVAVFNPPDLIPR